MIDYSGGDLVSMLYQRSLEIERRLQAALDLIRSGRYSTPMLAKELGISIPTVSRHVTALRERGYDIRSERSADGWRFVLIGHHDSQGHNGVAHKEDRL
jgi:biotin operon repressor